MARKIPLRELEVGIMKSLSDYVDGVREGVKEEIIDTAKEMVSTLKRTSPKDTGAYARGWTQKTKYESDESIRVRVYNKAKPQLTHLLENGHAKVNGGRVDGKPHIRPAEQEAEKRLGQKVREVVKW